LGTKASHVQVPVKTNLEKPNATIWEQTPAGQQSELIATLHCGHWGRVWSGGLLGKKVDWHAFEYPEHQWTAGHTELAAGLRTLVHDVDTGEGDDYDTDYDNDNDYDNDYDHSHGILSQRK
jgi:hypothetical protein